MKKEKKRGTFTRILKNVSSPIGIVISVGVAVFALVIVLITTQTQDCAKSKDGFATVIYHVDTTYSGFAVLITEHESKTLVEGFITPDNQEVYSSIPPGVYDIHQYYVNSDQYELMSDSVSTGLYPPDSNNYDTRSVNKSVRLCAGDEYHILGWIQPN